MPISWILFKLDCCTSTLKNESSHPDTTFSSFLLFVLRLLNPAFNYKQHSRCEAFSVADGNPSPFHISMSCRHECCG